MYPDTPEEVAPPYIPSEQPVFDVTFDSYAWSLPTEDVDEPIPSTPE